jgi:hypothetical protein
VTPDTLARLAAYFATEAAYLRAKFAKQPIQTLIGCPGCGNSTKAGFLCINCNDELAALLTAKEKK